MVSLKERAIFVIVVLFVNTDNKCYCYSYNWIYPNEDKCATIEGSMKEDHGDNYSFGNETKTVIIRFNVQSAMLINSNNFNYLEYILVINFHQEWMYHKTIGEKKYTSLYDTTVQNGMPNLIIIDSFGGKTETLKKFDQMLVQISPNRTLKYKKRIYVPVTCHKNFNLFTKYVENCTFKIVNKNYDYSLLWSVHESSEMLEADVKKQFVIKSRDCFEKKKIHKGCFCTQVTILFNDQFGFYLLNIYIPISIIVITSWVPFWVDQKSVMIRFSLSSSSMISMIKCTYSINNLYSSGESEAMDLWTNVCLTFVTGALVELLLIKSIPWLSFWLDNRKTNSKQLEPNAATMDISMEDDKNGSNSLNMYPSAEQPSSTTFKERLRRSIFDPQSAGIEIKSQLNSWKSKFTIHVASTIDVTSRIAFPVLFVLFNVYYWSQYLNNESDEN